MPSRHLGAARLKCPRCLKYKRPFKKVAFPFFFPKKKMEDTHLARFGVFGCVRGIRRKKRRVSCNSRRCSFCYSQSVFDVGVDAYAHLSRSVTLRIGKRKKILRGRKKKRAGERPCAYKYACGAAFRRYVGQSYATRATIRIEQRRWPISIRARYVSAGRPFFFDETWATQKQRIEQRQWSISIRVVRVSKN